MKRTIVISVFLVYFSYMVKAQISTEEQPYSWGRGEISIGTIPIVTMPFLDMETIRKEDLKNEEIKIFNDFVHSRNCGNSKCTLSLAQVCKCAVFKKVYLYKLM